jgi:hypothetical protein
MKTIALPPIETLRRIFEVRDDGVLVYREARHPYFKPGDVAGSQARERYAYVRLGGVRYGAHRIVFAIANGREPEGAIDHINGDPSDNRPCNLREATSAQNNHNRGAKAGRSLPKGVSIYKRTGSYQAQIVVGQKSKHLGYFKDLEAAELAYATAAERLHGEFARTTPAQPTTRRINAGRKTKLAFVDGNNYTFKELAEMLGMKQNTVWARYKVLQARGEVTMADLSRARYQHTPKSTNA